MSPDVVVLFIVLPQQPNTHSNTKTIPSLFAVSMSLRFMNEKYFLSHSSSFSGILNYTDE